jgi:hypothetical protein
VDSHTKTIVEMIILAAVAVRTLLMAVMAVMVLLLLGIHCKEIMICQDMQK